MFLLPGKHNWPAKVACLADLGHIKEIIYKAFLWPVKVKYHLRFKVSQLLCLQDNYQISQFFLLLQEMGGTM